jgi:predicted enzyme related to lactoylglutathione lyase
MADTTTVTRNAPGWVDLTASDAAEARKHYGELFGWEAVPETDPQAGGYALAKLGGKQVAGISPTQPGDPSPPHWTMYVIVDDVDATTAKAKAAGGMAYMEPFDVMEEGRMAIVADPSGAAFGLWQPKRHGGWEVHDAPGSVGWVELNSRGFDDKTKNFYKEVFGWEPVTSKASPMDYTEFKLDGKSIAGGMEMVDQIPKDVPSHWLVYFGADDVDATTSQNQELGGRTLMEPMDFPGGRFSVVADPQGVAFALVKMTPSAGS